MNLPIPHAATAADLPRFPVAFVIAVQQLRNMAVRLDTWLGARKRAAEDHDALNSMSDRELLDIGVSRASVPSVAASKSRLGEWPY